MGILYQTTRRIGRGGSFFHTWPSSKGFVSKAALNLQSIQPGIGETNLGILSLGLSSWPFHILAPSEIKVSKIFLTEFYWWNNATLSNLLFFVALLGIYCNSETVPSIHDKLLFDKLYHLQLVFQPWNLPKNPVVFFFKLLELGNKCGAKSYRWAHTVVKQKARYCLLWR